MKCNRKLESKKQYSYISKFYRGVPVVTLLDIEYFTKLSRFRYLSCIKRHKKEFLFGIDYWYLKDKYLLEFFCENPNFFYDSPRIFIMSSVGLLKLSYIQKTEISIKRKQ